jgi:cytochrome c oxidase assembly factor 3, fungi type
MGSSLIRARRPFVFKNAVVGITLASFAVTMCKRRLRRTQQSSSNPNIDFMTMRLVGQDNFDDVKVPDAPVAKRSQQGGQGSRA